MRCDKSWLWWSYSPDDEDNDHLIFKDENGQPVELQTGFNAWLKTDTAKHLLPPKGTRGSGSTQTTGGVARAPNKEDALYESLRNGLKNLG